MLLFKKFKNCPKKKFKYNYSDIQQKIPKNSRVIVVGGGIIGTSVAYHLGKMGWGNETIVLEQDKLTSGTTWHAAGLIETFGSLSETSTEFRKYSRDLYASLEKETGLSTGWNQCGFIELATNKDNLEQWRRVSAFNRKHGVDVQEISPKEVQNLFPLAKVDDIIAGFYVKEDGRANPVDITMSLSKGAKMNGVKFFENTRVKTVKSENGEVKGIVLENGSFIEAEYVVNCAGMWARQFGELSGVSVPNQAAEHYYLVTEKIPEVDPNWPVIEDPDSYTYIRPEGNGLMVGLFEPVAASWNVKKVPNVFSFDSIEPDWERMTPFLDKAMNRVPISLDSGVKLFFCGPESFTPDLSPIIGEAPELRNYFVGAGLNSIGIATGGGVGRLLAHWIVTGYPDMDVTGINIDRLHPYQSTPSYRDHRVVESLGMVYKCHYPSLSLKTARNCKVSPIHARTKEKNAYFRDVSGWESAGFYAPKGVEPIVLESSRTGWWERENWFQYWEKEHKACRENVVLIDMSFMSKFLVQGKDAGKILNKMATANVNGAIDSIKYTQFLNKFGKLEADITIMKMKEDKFIVIATDTAHRHVETLIKRRIEDEEANAFVTDITGSYAQINIQGPKSRELMEKLTSFDMSHENYPFASCKEIDIGYALVRCSRLTYVGELGFELFIPSEQALHVYDKIMEINDENNLGLVHAGLYALGSLRQEKAYRDYGHDMDNTDSLLEVGLGFTCDFEKEGGFIGKEAVLEEKKLPATKRLCQVLVNDPIPLLYHGEVLYRNDKIVGDIRSSSYGHTLGGAVGLAMVNAIAGGEKIVNSDFVNSGKWEIEIGAKKYPCTVSLKPMYDPNNKKIKI
eukprot:gene6234-10240_t